MKAAVVALTMIVVLTFACTASAAADIWAMTEKTSQGAVFEWYVRTNTYNDGEYEESVDIVRVGKDRWTRSSPPAVFTIWFWHTKGVWFFSTKDHQTQKQGLIGTVKDNALAKQVLKIVREDKDK